jgi:hypothetical protein
MHRDQRGNADAFGVQFADTRSFRCDHRNVDIGRRRNLSFWSCLVEFIDAGELQPSVWAPKCFGNR